MVLNCLLTASLYAKCEFVGISKGDCSCKIEYAYDLPNLQDEKVLLVYEVYGDGKIIVDMSYQPVVSEIEMPVFGLIFQLYKDMEEVNYYGFGPEENYIDRNKGAPHVSSPATPICFSLIHKTV